MNEKLLLKPSKAKFVLMLLSGIIGVAVGVFIGSIVGILVIIFSLIAVVASIISLFPNASYLLLTPEGFTFRNMFRSNFTRWKDVKLFESGVIQLGPADVSAKIAPGMSYVFFDYVDSYPRFENARAFMKGLNGHEAGLANTYDIKTEDLANLMNQWLQKYGVTSGQV